MGREVEDWTYVTQWTVQWKVLRNIVMRFKVQQKI